MQAPPPSADVEALLQAALAGDTDRVKAMLHKGAATHAHAKHHESEEHTPSHHHPHNPHHHHTHLGVGVNDTDSEGYTALSCASEMGHVAVVDMLITAGAAVDHADAVGATPLYIAAQEGRLDVVKALLQAGATVDQATTGGRTPLLIASEEGRTEVVKTLIKAKAKVNHAAKEDGATPIYAASMNGHAPVPVPIPRSAPTMCCGSSPLRTTDQSGGGFEGERRTAVRVEGGRGTRGGARGRGGRGGLNKRRAYKCELVAFLCFERAPGYEID
jgi:hypothetical protein